MNLAYRLALALTGWALSGAVAWPAAAPVCLPETEDSVILNRGFLEWPPMDRAQSFETAIFGMVSTKSGNVYIDNASIFLERPRRNIAFQGEYPGDSARVRPARLGALNIIDVIVEQHGGSGNGFNHHLLVNASGGVTALPSPSFEHSNMGGFHIGALGGGRGDGAVVWDAIWEDGAHYDPHRYRFTFL